MNIFFDSSALAKRYIEEKGSDQVQAIPASASALAGPMRYISPAPRNGRPAFVGGQFNGSAAMLVFLIVFNLVFVITGRKWITRAVAH